MRILRSLTARKIAAVFGMMASAGAGYHVRDWVDRGQSQTNLRTELSDRTTPCGSAQGLTALPLERPAQYSAQIEKRIGEYMQKNSDIAVCPVMNKRGQITYFLFAAKTPGAGYTGMTQDIKGLAR